MNIASRAGEAKEAAWPFRHKIPDLKSVLVSELAQHGDWIVANISNSGVWPAVSQKVRWRGVDIWWPQEYPAYCAVY